ncbi:hypothetical protein B9Z55_008756 [Caenorhabditis nigoni]|uniref:BZIP domain-containing protein n=1 Tax=Caenorhabditis nigoni TaxID=1611254 RepID=A0A2G5UPW4_9PELO|nr:hypothetical protein B9Z55_008756 [Caenorhabditis nigoni]
MADGSEVFQFLLDTLNGQINNNETTPSGIPEFSGSNNQNLEEQEIPEILKVIMDFQKNSVPEDVVPEDVESENPIFNLLNQGIQNNEKNPEILEKLNRFFSISSIDQVDHDQNFEKNNEIDMDDTTEEWREEYRKLNQNETKFDKKDEERRRQMAKNREYARKCVQKKKDMRKQAEVRSVQIQRRIHLQQKITAIKEKNSNFAVELRKMTGETQILEEQKTYEQLKQAMNQKFDSLFAVDETVNLNFHRFASAREEFEKAATDLRMKNGVIGTLGSRKIRAKQQMEWRQHLYDISVNEHKLRREMKLSELADDYVKNTVPKAAPLIQSIPKDVLDQLIQNNRAADLEEFYRFVGDNSTTDSAPHFFVDNSDKKNRQKSIMDQNNQNPDDPPDGFPGEIDNEPPNFIQSAPEIPKNNENEEPVVWNGKPDREKTLNELNRRIGDDNDVIECLARAVDQNSELPVISEEEVERELENFKISENSNSAPNRVLEESGPITPDDVARREFSVAEEILGPSDSLPPSRAPPKKRRLISKVKTMDRRTKDRRTKLEMKMLKQTPGVFEAVKKEQNRNNSRRYLEKKKSDKEDLEISIDKLKNDSGELKTLIDMMEMGNSDNFWIEKKNQLARTIFEEKSDGRLEKKEAIDDLEIELKKIAKKKKDGATKAGTIAAQKSRKTRDLVIAQLELEEYDWQTTVKQLEAIKTELDFILPLQCHDPSGRFEEIAQPHEIGDTFGDTSSDAGEPPDLSEHDSDDGEGPPPLSPPHSIAIVQKYASGSADSLDWADETEPCTPPPTSDWPIFSPSAAFSNESGLSPGSSAPISSGLSATGSWHQTHSGIDLAAGTPKPSQRHGTRPAQRTASDTLNSCSSAPMWSYGTPSGLPSVGSFPNGSWHQANSGIGSSAGTQKPTQQRGTRSAQGVRPDPTHGVKKTAKPSPTVHFGPGTPVCTPGRGMSASSAGMLLVRAMSHNHNGSREPPPGPRRQQDQGTSPPLVSTTIQLQKSNNGRIMTAQHTGDSSAEGSTQQGFRRVLTHDYYNEKDTMSLPRPVAKQGQPGFSSSADRFQPVAPFAATASDGPLTAAPVAPKQQAYLGSVPDAPTLPVAAYHKKDYGTQQDAKPSIYLQNPLGRSGIGGSAGPQRPPRPVSTVLHLRNHPNMGSMPAAYSALQRAEATAQPTNYALRVGNQRAQAGSGSGTAHVAPIPPHVFPTTSGSAHCHGRGSISRKRTAASEGSLDGGPGFSTAKSSSRKRAHTLHGEIEGMEEGSGFN